MNSLFIIFEAPFPGNRNNTERRTPKYGERILGRFYDCQTFSHLAVVAHDVVVFDISSDSLRTFILICISYLIIFHFPSNVIRGYLCVANNIISQLDLLIDVEYHFCDVFCFFLRYFEDGKQNFNSNSTGAQVYSVWQGHTKYHFLLDGMP